MDEKVILADAFRLAIREAQKGRGKVSPNPLVGCAIVSPEGQLLSVGHHEKVGSDHAEVSALNKIASRNLLRGATVLVTLEPCAHVGRTPACASTLAKLPIGQVIYAVEDPNPLVAGQGAKILEAAGISVRKLEACPEISDRSEIISECERLAEIFLWNMRKQKPFVAIKIASTLDAKVALNSGESKWITGSKAREHVHQMRAAYDAILIGYRTFALDNPNLDTRLFQQLIPDRKVVLIDAEGKSLESLAASNLTKVHAASQIYVVTDRKKNISTKHWQTIPIEFAGRGEFAVNELLDSIWQSGIRSVMVEGGPTTQAQFFKTPGTFQRLHLYLAPKILGGKQSVGWSEGFGCATLAQALQLKGLQATQIEDDLYLTARIP